MRRMDHCDGPSSFLPDSLPYPHFVVCRYLGGGGVLKFVRL